MEHNVDCPRGMGVAGGHWIEDVKDKVGTSQAPSWLDVTRSLFLVTALLPLIRSLSSAGQYVSVGIVGHRRGQVYARPP